MITIASINVGQSLQNGRPPPCFPQTCPSLGYFAILGLAGLFVAFWAALETLMGFLIREGAVEYKPGPLEPPQPGSGPEDENILSMARDLQRQVNRPKFGEITDLAWSEYQPWYWAGWKRKSIRKPFILLLSTDLRGRLDAEEWKTLLTYYFLGLKPRLRLLLRLVGPFIVTIFLLILVGLVVSLEYGLQISRLYGQFVASPITLITLILLFANAKRVALRWDKWVAGLMDQRALLEVFKKIDQLQLPRLENAKKRHGWVAHLWPMPNITERIQNLTDE
jgi:hypothetical protein